MTDVIRDIANYPMSEDYELLWELAQKQGVVCEVDYDFYRDDSHPPVRDIARTIFGHGSVAISARGTCYIEDDKKADFIEACKKYHVKIIVPLVDDENLKQEAIDVIKKKIKAACELIENLDENAIARAVLDSIAVQKYYGNKIFRAKMATMPDALKDKFPPRTTLDAIGSDRCKASTEQKA